jgi:anaerobic magnesium-protoporphyrin IX monomethyl ester cyclase
MRPLRRLLLVRTNPWRPRHGASPPLGLLMLASAARAWFDPRLEVRVIDLNVRGWGVDDLGSVLREFEPDVVGLSALSVEHLDLLAAARLVKSWRRDVPVLVGGPHATTFGETLAGNTDIDFVVRGEGERTLTELLGLLRDGGDPQTIPGLLHRVDGKVTSTGARAFLDDLDSLPLPAWDLVDPRSYTRKTNMNGLLAAAPYMSVMTSRACPFECAYCHRLFGRGFRPHSVERVLEELTILRRRHGVREIHFIDDCFNLRRDRAIAICEGIVTRDLGLRIAFPNGVKGDLMPPELIAALKAAGAYVITYAVESANERVQRIVNKQLDLVKVARAIDDTYRAGLIPAGFFMLGLPTETLAEIENTIRFACGSSVLKAYFFTAVPFPGTDLLRIAQEAYPGLSLGRDVIDNSSYWSARPFYTAATGVDIQRIQRSAYRRFYGDPRRVVRILRLFPKNEHLVRGLFYGLQAGFPAVERLNRLRSRSAAAR